VGAFSMLSINNARGPEGRRGSNKIRFTVSLTGTIVDDD
jgi:hypothetical protein